MFHKIFKRQVDGQNRHIDRDRQTDRQTDRQVRSRHDSDKQSRGREKMERGNEK